MTRRPARTGIFGGTFDPVHLGHLIMADEVLSRLKLQRLLFMPASRPAHKRSRALTGVEHRIAMLRLAIRGHRGFAVSRIEADGAGI
ncbi:MAG TPA: adenylyltransferase/cytidyltransferase family protein, partial [Candidatus Eisenbacteria bacterium]